MPPVVKDTKSGRDRKADLIVDPSVSESWRAGHLRSVAFAGSLGGGRGLLEGAVDDRIDAVAQAGTHLEHPKVHCVTSGVSPSSSGCGSSPGRRIGHEYVSSSSRRSSASSARISSSRTYCMYGTGRAGWAASVARKDAATGLEDSR